MNAPLVRGLNPQDWPWLLALNAANEAAVARFLKREIGFLDISRACRAALDHHTFDPRPTLDALWNVDAWARREVNRWTS